MNIPVVFWLKGSFWKAMPRTNGKAKAKAKARAPQWTPINVEREVAELRMRGPAQQWDILHAAYYMRDNWFYRIVIPLHEHLAGANRMYRERACLFDEEAVWRPPPRSEPPSLATDALRQVIRNEAVDELALVRRQLRDTFAELVRMRDRAQRALLLDEGEEPEVARARLIDAMQDVLRVDWRSYHRI